MTDQSPKPHDRFFKLIFSEPSQAAALLRGALPAGLKELLDLDSLKLDNNSYVDDRLKEHFADLVFDCNCHSPALSMKLVLLIEHKSYVSPHIHLQLLRYMLQIWEKMETNGEPLQPVIPLVVYHGQARWRAIPFWRYFADTFPENLLPYLPSFEYVYLNLEEKPVEDIQITFENKFVFQTLLLMKFIRQPNLDQYIDQIFFGAKVDGEEEQVTRFFRKFITYIYQCSKMEKQAIEKIEQSLVEYWGYEPGSPAEQLLNEGRAAGREEGREEGREAIVRSMMGKGFTGAEIANLTDLPLEEVAQMMAKYS